MLEGLITGKEAAQILGIRIAALDAAGKIGAFWTGEEMDKPHETLNAYEVCNTARTFSVGVVCRISILPFGSIHTAGATQITAGRVLRPC